MSMGSSQRQKVLVVDDTPENIQVLMETLKDDYAIVAAIDGEKALRMARSAPAPDLILLDIMMPGMNGYEVCRQLKQDPATREIPVIFVTALNDEHDEAEGLDLGAVDFISKPFRPLLIKKRVHNQLELKRHRDTLEIMVQQRTRELHLTQEVTFESLANLAETRDPETGGHIRRTQNYVRVLAERLESDSAYASELDETTVYMLHVSAPLHDIGKVGVPDHILLKPDKLTENEYIEMRKHTVYGRDALLAAEKKLGSNSFLRLAREIAYGHHERWDGSGYPQGLSGLDIPLCARLMALADVYDALISKRVYKPPYPHSKAVQIISSGSGTHFDPVVVDAFMELNEIFRAIALEHADHEEERLVLRR